MTVINFNHNLEKTYMHNTAVNYSTDQMFVCKPKTVPLLTHYLHIKVGDFIYHMNIFMKYLERAASEGWSVTSGDNDLGKKASGSSRAGSIGQIGDHENFIDEDEDDPPSPSTASKIANGNLTFACTYCPACFETYTQVKNHEQVWAFWFYNFPYIIHFPKGCLFYKAYFLHII